MTSLRKARPFPSMRAPFGSERSWSSFSLRGGASAKVSSVKASPSAARGLAFATALAAVMSLAGTASARPEMPGELQKQGDMPCPPTCSICHISSAGGGPRTLFGTRLQENGLSEATPANLAVALDGLRVTEADSDGDGVIDVDELSAGTDPNGDGSLCGPEYGCARVEPRGPVDGVASVAAMVTALGGVLLMRRGRR